MIANTQNFSSFHEEFNAKSLESIQKRINIFSLCNIMSGHQLGLIISQYPAVLFASDDKDIISNIDGLFEYFSKSQVYLFLFTSYFFASSEKFFIGFFQVHKIVLLNPYVLLENFESLEKKLTYFFYCMGLENTDLTECISWPNMSLEEIVMRHEFLVKAGKYVMPDAKKPQLKIVRFPFCTSFFFFF